MPLRGLRRIPASVTVQTALKLSDAVEYLQRQTFARNSCYPEPLCYVIVRKIESNERGSLLAAILFIKTF
jgi:hypothetical protein